MTHDDVSFVVNASAAAAVIGLIWLWQRYDAWKVRTETARWKRERLRTLRVRFEELDDRIVRARVRVELLPRSLAVMADIRAATRPVPERLLKAVR